MSESENPDYLLQLQELFPMAEPSLLSDVYYCKQNLEEATSFLMDLFYEEEQKKQIPAKQNTISYSRLAERKRKEQKSNDYSLSKTSTSSVSGQVFSAEKANNKWQELMDRGLDFASVRKLESIQSLLPFVSKDEILDVYFIAGKSLARTIQIFIDIYPFLLFANTTDLTKEAKSYRNFAAEELQQFITKQSQEELALLALLNEAKEEEEEKKDFVPSSSSSEKVSRSAQNSFSCSTDNLGVQQNKFQIVKRKMKSNPSSNQEPASRKEINTIRDTILRLRSLRQSAIMRNDFRALKDINETLTRFESQFAQFSSQRIEVVLNELETDISCCRESNFKTDLHSFTKEESQLILATLFASVLNNDYISTITIVTGVGTHSENGRSILRPFVSQFLNAQSFKFSETYSGVFVVRLSNDKN